MIRWFTRHPVAPNLLLLSIFALALVYVPFLKKTTFPQTPDRNVNINISWSNASVDEMVDAVCKPIEQKLEGVSNMSNYSCRAAEGSASLRATMQWGSSYEEFFDDVDAAVASANLPPEARTPSVTRASSGFETFIASVSISGFDDLYNLKAYAEQFEDNLKRSTSITETELSGFSDMKYFVDLDPGMLQALNLSVSDIASMLNRESVNSSLGGLDGASLEYRLKVENRKTTITDLENTYLKTFPDGAILTLGDIANIYLAFEDNVAKNLYNGAPSATVSIYRTDSQDMLKLASELYDYVEKVQDNLPENVTIAIANDLSKLTKDRLTMVVKNGIAGIILAFLVLWLFFNLRYSFWIAVGLPLSFAGGLVLMHFMGMTINLMTLAGLLIAIGILMDDAIVVAENIHSHHQLGKSKMDAAVDGALEVFPGVLSSFMTTVMIAFTISFLEGEMGVVLAAVPMAIILVLIISLVEAFLILPAHLGHSLRDQKKPQAQLRQKFYRSFNYMRDHLVYPLTKKFISLRGISLIILIAIFASGPLALKTGMVKRIVFPIVESDTIDARVLYAAGTKLETTIEATDYLIAALNDTLDDYAAQYPKQPTLLERYIVRYGRNADSGDSGNHQATIMVDINKDRAITSEEFAALWNEKAGIMPDIVSLNILPNAPGPGGDSLYIRVVSDNEEALIRASQTLEQHLQNINAVRGVVHDLRAGTPEWKFSLTPLALNLGFSTADIAQQVRANIFGNITDELQLNKDTIEISLRYGGDDIRVLNLLENIMVKSPAGNMVPLQTLVHMERDYSPTRVSRYNGDMVNRMRGSINEEIMLGTEVQDILQKKIFPEIQKAEPEVSFRMGGRQEDSLQMLNSLKKGALLGLFGIYVVLALQFRSWVQPLAVMLILPLVFTGSVWGHFLLGFNISMPSLLGVVLMLGIAVNDSILLVLFIRRGVEKGIPLRKAAALASKERFRAVFLTSVTTVAGVLPLLLETDAQAQVIQPIAVSIAFGLIMSTIMVLYFVPTIYVIIEDIKNFLARMVSKAFQSLSNNTTD